MVTRSGVVAAVVSALAVWGAGVCEGKDVSGKSKTSGPPKEGSWVPIPALTDEFEGGKLDASKWHDHNPTWKGRLPAFFARHNVTVSGGKLHLAMRKEDLKGLPKGYHTFTSAAVKSKAAVRYGYFEVRCKPMDSHGSSAFWFYAQTPETWTEIDVFEMGAGAPKHQHIVHMNAHVFHTLADPDRHWSKGGRWTAPYRLADAYHVYALQWTREKLTYLVDGVVVREMPNTHWHQPLHLNFDSETMVGWFGLPKPKDLPSTFSVEYVRSWRKAGGYGPERHRWCEITFSKAEAAAQKGKTARYEIDADGGGSVVVVARHGGSPRPALVHLEYRDEAFFKGLTAPKAEKTVRLTDAKGRKLTLAFTWSRIKGYNRNQGYRADWVELTPAKRPAEGAEAVYEFTADGRKRVRFTLRY